MKKIYLICFAVFAFNAGASEISVNPMFINVAGGGQGTITLINNTDGKKNILLDVIDRTMLRSSVCLLNDGVEEVELGAGEAKHIKVVCKKNRLKELHFVQVDFSTFQQRELRRVVLH